MGVQDTLVNDPKHGVTIRLYEDLTNLIVLSAKIQESPYAYLGEPEEIVYKCVFSHMNASECYPPLVPSLSHTLRQQASRFCSRQCTSPRFPLSQIVPLLVPSPKTISSKWCDIPLWN